MYMHVCMYVYTGDAKQEGGREGGAIIPELYIPDINVNLCMCMCGPPRWINRIHDIIRYMMFNEYCRFLNQACTWFLEIVFVQASICVCVCVCVRPQAIKNHSHEMKPE